MASMREYEKRLEALEEAYAPPDMREAVVLFMACFSLGPLVAIITETRAGKFRVERLEGESEDDLRQRAAGEARAKLGPNDLGPGNILMLYDVRQDEDGENSCRLDRHKTLNNPKGDNLEPREFTKQYARAREDEAAPRNPDPELLEPPKPYVPERIPRQVIEIKRQEGPTVGHWLMG
jgi:hypothetical protein